MYQSQISSVVSSGVEWSVVERPVLVSAAWAGRVGPQHCRPALLTTLDSLSLSLSSLSSLSSLHSLHTIKTGSSLTRPHTPHSRLHSVKSEIDIITKHAGEERPDQSRIDSQELKVTEL